jgi:hypothetical protein
MEAVLKHGGGVEAWMAHRSKDGTPRHGRRTEAWMAHRSMEAWRYSSVFFFFFFSFAPFSFPFPFPFPFPLVLFSSSILRANA